MLYDYWWWEKMQLMLVIFWLKPVAGLFEYPLPKGSGKIYLLRFPLSWDDVSVMNLPLPYFEINLR